MKRLWLWLWVSVWSLHALAAPVTPQTLHLLGRSHVEGYELALSPDDREWLRARGTLTLGTSAPDYAPFDISHNGLDYEGLTADYAQLLGELLGVAVHVRRYGHRGDAVQALHNGDIDLLGSANEYEFQDPTLIRAGDYAEDQPVLVTRPDQKAKAEGEMANVRVAMLDHYRPAAAFAALYPRASLQGYPSVLDALSAVAFGRADVYLGDAITADYQIASNAFDNLQLADFSRLESSGFAFATSAQDARLARIIRAAIESVPATERMALLHRWNADAKGMPDQRTLQLSDQEQAWLTDHPRVKLAVDPSFVPFTFFDQQGQLRGLSADVLARVTQLTGLQFDIVRESGVVAMIGALGRGSVDLIGALTPSGLHNGTLSFTRPYLSTPNVLISPSATVSDFEDLTGKALAVVAGDARNADLQQRYPRVRLVPVINTEHVFDAVERGVTSAGITSLMAARYRIARRRDDEPWHVVATLADAPAQLAFAVRPEAWQLQSILDKVLLSMPPADFQTLINRWRGDRVERENYWQRHRHLIMVGGSILLVLLLLSAAALAWQRRLMAKLHAAQLEADAANRAKTTFLATMSHEIRTPMNAVLGMLEMASQQAEKGVLDRAAIEVASTSAHSLLELIGDILDVVRIESGQLALRPQPVALRELAASVIRAFEGLARQKNIALDLSDDGLGDVHVLLDPLRFKQVLSNLLGNGIKFTERGSVSLSLSLAAEKTAGQCWLHCRVKDTGIGIDAASQALLFQPFAQVSQQQAGGSGLGLMISRHLCELMGGHLELVSAPGSGTEVTVELPVPIVQRPEVHAQALPVVAVVAQLRVLVVDDYAPNRLLLARQLEWMGHQVVVVDDGEAALAVWQPGQFDAVITDCNMPRMDGYALTREIRRRETLTNEAPVLIFGFTANAQPQEQARCLDAGMNDCLFKPLGLERLRQALHPLSSARASMPPTDRTSSVWLPEVLEQLAGGNRDIVDTLLEELRVSLDQDGRDLRDLWQRNDSAGLNHVAHRIKGGARIVRATALVDCCEALEDVIAQGQVDRVDRAVDDLLQAVSELGTAILLYRA
ncbi:transporter substrate-binding domain-containing protein [Pseudomonas sp. dw_358]|uniref:ATP-binding protein n=1 Tax=Pseudomonas sp. dw_358 TaxID=2720083 RepID=UPI001BD6A2C1|nr:transporter substrate-binding domain-containing protein [Pseudomonas sp. dw_358]